MLGSVLLASALVFTPADATNAYEAAAGLVSNCTPRDAGTIRGRLAANWILDRVSRCGVDASLDKFRAATPAGERDFANVVVEFPGTNPGAPWIVFMSHFDTAPNIGKGFEGANDGASTSGLLIALAAAIRRAGPEALKAPVALVWMDGEEHQIAYTDRDGFQGSKRMAAEFKRRGRKVRAAVCLDMLGDRDLHVSIPSNSTPALSRLALLAASREAGLADRVSPMENNLAVLDDHVAFLEAGFPAIDLIDFHYGSAPGLNDYWHTSADTLDKLSIDSLSLSGRLAVSLLSLLELK